MEEKEAQEAVVQGRGCFPSEAFEEGALGFGPD